MAFEKEFEARVNREGEHEEVILRSGATSFALRPEGDERGYFKTGKVRGVFTMVEAAPDDSGPVVETPAKKGK